MNFEKYDLIKFKAGLGELGLELGDLELNRLIQYYELLIEWNSFMNLTAITEFDEVCTKHFLDSLSLCKAIDCTKPLTLIDVGTGAGFPGIPLKLAFPNLHVVLLDSLGKRVRFLNEVIDALGLEDIEAVHGRAEDFAKPGSYREKFDLCVSRAVEDLSVLSEYCIPFVKPGGLFVSYKSDKILNELSGAERSINILGGSLLKCETFILPNSDINRTLLIIKKLKTTQKKYPRKAGIPAKEPL